MTHQGKFLITILLLIQSSFINAALPADTRGWEMVPNVIRINGIDESYLEVNTNGPVNRVYIEELFNVFGEPTETMLELHDDGLNGDRISGDHIYTGGPYKYDYSLGNPAFFYYGSDLIDSPAGMRSTGLTSKIFIEETSGIITNFLEQPSVILIDQNLSSPDYTKITDDMVATSHIININTNSYIAQGLLRTTPNTGGALTDATQRIYQRLPDQFDFIYFISTNKLERLPRITRRNFNSGISFVTQIEYTGSAQSLTDATSSYGSKGKLKTFISLDYLSRGLHTNNAIHELLHHWLAKFDPSLGINFGSHINGYNNLYSILGGAEWINNPDGTFTYNCAIPIIFTQANSFEKYMMGLIDPDQVEPIYVLDVDENSVYNCGQVIEGNIRTVTIEDIQAIHGPRLPLVADAQHDFNIAFVVETNDRFLSPAELTFYHKMAEHFTSQVPAGLPDPTVRTNNWASINRFFGENASFTSDIPYLVPAAATNLEARAKRGRINVRWTEVEDATSYLVYRRSNTQTEFSLINEVQYPIVVDTLTANSSSAEYYVVSKNKHGVGPDSATIMVTKTARRARR